MFIPFQSLQLARLYLNSLAGSTTRTDIRTKLKDIPRESDGYDSIYDETISRIKRQVCKSRRLATKTLCWIVYAKRQFVISELQHALAIEAGQRGFDYENITDPDDILSVCGGLVVIDEEKKLVRLVHHTVQEYFERTRNFWFPDENYGYADPEAYLTTVCITYLSFRAVGKQILLPERDFGKRLVSNKF